MKIFNVKVSAWSVLVALFVMQAAFGISYGQYNSPVIDFEFVKNLNDIQNIFGVYPNINLKLIKAVDILNYIDFVFMLAYSWFLASLFYSVYKYFNKKIFLSGIILAILSLVFDFFENIQLFKITQKFIVGNNIAYNITALHILTYIKWISLALAFALLTLKYFYEKNKYKLLSLILFIPLILSGLALSLKNLSIEKVFVYSIFASFGYFISLALFYRKKLKY